MGSNTSCGITSDVASTRRNKFATVRGMHPIDALSTPDIAASSGAASVGVGFTRAMQLVQHTIPNYEPKFLIRLQDRIGSGAVQFHGFVIVRFQSTAFGVEYSDLKRDDDYFLRFDWGIDDAGNGKLICCPGKTFLELAQNLADYFKSIGEAAENWLQQVHEVEDEHVPHSNTLYQMHIMKRLDIGSMGGHGLDIGRLPWQRIPAQDGTVTTENLLKVLKRVKDRKYSDAFWNCDHFADALAKELNPEALPPNAHELIQPCERWAEDQNWPMLSSHHTFRPSLQQSSDDDRELALGAIESAPALVPPGSPDDSNCFLEVDAAVHEIGEAEARAVPAWSPDSFHCRHFDTPSLPLSSFANRTAISAWKSMKLQRWLFNVKTTEAAVLEPCDAKPHVDAPTCPLSRLQDGDPVLDAQEAVPLAIPHWAVPEPGHAELNAVPTWSLDEMVDKILDDPEAVLKGVHHSAVHEPGEDEAHAEATLPPLSSLDDSNLVLDALEAVLPAIPHLTVREPGHAEPSVVPIWSVSGILDDPEAVSKAVQHSSVHKPGQAEPRTVATWSPDSFHCRNFGTESGLLSSDASRPAISSWRMPMMPHRRLFNIEKTHAVALESCEAEPCLVPAWFPDSFHCRHFDTPSLPLSSFANRTAISAWTPMNLQRWLFNVKTTEAAVLEPCDAKPHDAATCPLSRLDDGDLVLDAQEAVPLAIPHWAVPEPGHAEPNAVPSEPSPAMVKSL